MKRLIIFCAVVIGALCGFARSDESEMTALRNWNAGTQVSAATVEKFGIERCFTATEITPEIFARIKGKSFAEGCTTPLSDLRYLKVLHTDAEGRILLGEIICNKAISRDLLDIFRELFNAGYPIERMTLIDNYGADDQASMTANNSSAFNFRYVSGTRKLSNHSLGLAIDINPLYNPYVRRLNSKSPVVEPAAAAPYADRSKPSAYRMTKGDLCHRLFTSHGFIWGGDWKTVKDYQHFEKKTAK